MQIEVGDIVSCIVDRIVGTTVFVKISGNGEGSIILPEIAPGRIRNLRDYVVPKKQIICKVIRKNESRIELSLRRVTPKEQKELKEKINIEKSYRSVLKQILQENFETLINKIEENGSSYEFMENAKTNPKELEKIIGKDSAKKVLEIINLQKKKKVLIRKEFKLTTTSSNGLELIKETLKKNKDIIAKYLAGGKYSLEKETEDSKKTDDEIKARIDEIEKIAKNKKMEFMQTK